eukprot:8106089-Pyramimonas_sp.AAC.1
MCPREVPARGVEGVHGRLLRHEEHALLLLDGDAGRRHLSALLLRQSGGERGFCARQLLRLSL